MSQDRQGLSGRGMIGLGGLQVGCLVVGVGAGWLLDDWLGTSPTLTLVGVGVGIILAVLGSWVRIRKYLSR